ncbi:MAG: RimK/LysX family protein [bacterium]|nr:RimK/LysX family protein [bacterium]
MNRVRQEPQWIIGWREWLSLPTLGISEVKAKIDTGARSSALYAFNVKRFRRDDEQMVRFSVHPYQRDGRTTVVSEAVLLEDRIIRSSTGHEEVRPVIRTTVKILEREWEIELTLANRDDMGFRMLLGREAIRGRFLIDTGRSFRAGKPLRPKPAQKQGRKT